MQRKTHRSYDLAFYFGLNAALAGLIILFVWASG